MVILKGNFFLSGSNQKRDKNMSEIIIGYANVKVSLNWLNKNINSNMLTKGLR
jgi:hypothetical protein